MRALALVAAGAAGLGLAVVPALAANDAAVIASDDLRFTPQTVSIPVGGEVGWSYPEGGSAHNVTFPDGYAQPANPAAAGWTASRTFEADGTFTYRCGLHGSMTGTVIVGGGGPGTTTTGTTTTTTTTTPTTTTPTQPSPAPSPDPVADETFTAAPTRKRFCARRTHACKRPGLVLAIDLDAPAARTITGVLRRAGKPVGSLSLEAAPGPATYRFKRVAGKRLRAGRHSLALTLGTLTHTLRFRVRA